LVPATGAVLAGGKSLRMGTEKAFLKMNGVELIRIVIEEMKKIVAEVLVVGAGCGALKIPGVKIVKDVVPGCGPLGGIHAVLANSSYERCLVAGCDMPFFNARLGELLIAEAEGYDAAVPLVKGLPEPLFAVYTRRCIKHVESNLLKKWYKITSFYPLVRVNFLKEEYIKSALKYNGKIEKFFFNVNTPQDLEKAKNMIEAVEEKCT